MSCLPFNIMIIDDIQLQRPVPGRLAESGVSLTANQVSLVRAPVRPHTFVEIYHEIISTVILPLPLIQEGQMSVSSEFMCTTRDSQKVRGQFE